MNSHCETTDLLVFSHLRWDFVFERSQHLHSRFAKYRRVFFVEEPVLGSVEIPRFHLRETPEGVQIAVPHLPKSLKSEDIEPVLRDLVDELIFEEDLSRFVLWYDSPRALPFTRHLEAQHVIFDLQGKVDSSAETLELLRKADLALTGSSVQYEALKSTFPNLEFVPSSVDHDHFSQGRQSLVEPTDQVNLSHPRIGFYGVIDDRLNFELIEELAIKRPDWQFVLVGPVMEGDPEKLFHSKNVHVLGKKDYHELPLYLSGWDCAILPFRQSERTAYLSPTMALEFLSAGKPVVATPLPEIRTFLGDLGLVWTAETTEEFLRCIEDALASRETREWSEEFEGLVTGKTWEETFLAIASLEKDLKASQKGVRIQRIEPTILSPERIN